MSNQQLKNYFERFFPKEMVKLEKFYTALDYESFEQYLPLLNGIDTFCLRLLQAKLFKEKICIYADYDTDAISAATVMFWGLVELGFDKKLITYYTPDRFSESYGVNKTAVTELAKENDLIITVDCGISSVEEAQLLKETKCDFLITDHHQMSAALPEAVGIVNPQLWNLSKEQLSGFKKQQTLEKKKILARLGNFDQESLKLLLSRISEETKIGWKYSTKQLSQSTVGAGVAWFSIVWLGYFLKSVKQSKVTFSNLNRLLAMVAIGTVADCQSLAEFTNRTLVKAGLMIINKRQSKLTGLNELLLQTGLSEKMSAGYLINSQDLGFTISPILNSPGRIAHAKVAIEAFVSDDSVIVQQRVAEIIELNTDRKALVGKIIRTVEAQALEQFEKGQKFLWLSGSWNKGLIGLVASRLNAMYSLPTVVLSTETSAIGGSMRAPEGYDLAQMLRACKEWLKAGGGHAQAAGFSLDKSQLAGFRKAISVEMAKQAAAMKSKDTFVVDTALEELLPKQLKPLAQQKNVLFLTSEEAGGKFLSELWQLDPFGQGFPIPQIVLIGQLKDSKYMGDSNQHIKGKVGGVGVTYFNVSKEELIILEESTKEKKEILFLAKPSINVFRGVINYELICEKIHRL
jgi:single-stranded-DNA-specific exonuclease